MTIDFAQDSRSARASDASLEHFDIVIVGAGLSGIGAACHLKLKSPGKRIVILEARGAIGGTWDLFRYPGVRSDSDMSTFGYAFRPWDGAKAIADGASIAGYVRNTAEEFGVDRLIRFGHRLIQASWRSAGASWALQLEGEGDADVRITCDFLYMCTGYYDYGQGHMPAWPGMERFAGSIVHPQAWPDDLDYAGRQALVIGSGATAVTLVPAMAATATHVTMLQRSPTYVVSRPAEDPVARRLRRAPRGLANRLVRWTNIALQMYFYNLARRKPAAVRAQILKLAQNELGAGFDAGAMFAARYNPWDQRLCLVPDSDLFAAIRSGKASIVNGEIETFIETGLRLRSGEELKADIIVAATGLVMRLMGGADIVVDGAKVDLGKTFTYKGVMYSGIPNLASAFGYTNASWTLKCDLSAEYVCRLINFMDRRGYAVCTPRSDAPKAPEDPTLPLSSGYVERARARLPKQSLKRPWRMNQNYALDLMDYRFGALEDGALEFRARTTARASAR
jgi:monooxygenase